MPSPCVRLEGWLRAVLASLLLLGSGVLAQERGFAVHRYDGTSAGSTQFLVERPWYSSVRLLAAGLTGDYSFNSLRPRQPTGRGPLTPIISHALVGHVDLAAAFFDRVQLNASLPITFLELGTPELVSGVAPLRAVGVGDPRLGVLVRLAGQPEEDAVSLHAGANVWIPIGADVIHQGDLGVRLMPRVVLAGAFGKGRWAVDAAFLLRPYASLGPPQLGMTAAPEARLGFAIGLSQLDGRLTLGPEVQFSTQVVGEHAFALEGMSLELLGGAQYVIGDQLLLGVAGGTALLGAAGTPDARAIVRLAWAPRSSKSAPAVIVERPKEPVVVVIDDPDSDGVPTAIDRCPFEPESKNGVRDEDGCPEYLMPAGSALASVLTVSAEKRVDEVRPSPLPVSPLPQGEGEVAATFLTMDSDGDGVPDEADRCPVAPEDLDEFEDEDGCPELDNDDDGVADALDRCPVTAESRNGITDDDGCPDLAPDADRDGIADVADRCPYEPETRDGVRDDDGCPEHQPVATVSLARLIDSAVRLDAPAPSITVQEAPSENDSDKDGVTDDEDRCPASPEDLDGFEDGDGCREPDNDDDGVPDAKDGCPDEAETVNGWKDTDGCPDEHEDVDSDGIEYELDRCPFEPGNASDGCPHAPPPALVLADVPLTLGKAAALTEAQRTAADLDRDGVRDDEDRCPTSAEDLDGFEDEDGCPERDNDQDGLEDAKDKCPFAAETINGKNDTDGCPDVGASAVTIQGHAVVINGVVRFKSASANLERSALPLLAQVAARLRAASTLSIEISGHTDDVGSARKNIVLSQRRAETIRKVLIKAGVAPARLIARGYGPTRPVATNKTAKGREQNRRVEFLILGETE